MSSRSDETLPATRRPKSRKSIAHLPSAEHASSMDKENMTADIGALSGTQKRNALGDRPSKKSRSKSIGPGGLDGLSEGSGNRRKSMAMPPPRSILKPTIPPLPEIPALGTSRRTSPKKPQQAGLASVSHNSSIDGILGRNDPENSPLVTGTEGLVNPFALQGNPSVADTRVALRTEEEQQQSAREREEKEKVDAEMDLKARRDARRKSLASRRVSFAPEATLHTWDVVEYLQDFTASSSSTDSTRRASSASTLTASSPHPPAPGATGSDASEPPSTPPEQIEETITESPAHQRDLHQKKRRRSSGIPPLNFNNPDDEDFSSSPYSDVSGVDANEANNDSSIDGDEGSDSNSDSNDGDTAMSLDIDNNTDMSMASVRSASSSTGSSARLDQALELAARQAATHEIDFRDRDASEAVAEDEDVLASFAPWSKKANIQNLSSMQDQENMNPFSPAFKAGTAESHDQSMDSDGEMTMDMTRAVGHIMPVDQSDDEMTMDMTVAMGGIVSTQSSTTSRRKSTLPARRQSTRRRSSVRKSLGDETMDLTMAVGGIQQVGKQDQDEEVPIDAPEDEEMTMEFTSVIGGVLAPGNVLSKFDKNDNSASDTSKSDTRRQSFESDIREDTMDMTTAFGGIMPPVSEDTNQDGNNTVGMDITTAFGKILPHTSSPENRLQAKQIMEQEVDSAEPIMSPAGNAIVSSAQKTVQGPTAISETGSPGLAAFKGRGLRRSGGPRPSTTPRPRESEGVLGTPLKGPATPVKQLTPKPARPTTPGKTPPSKNIVMRTASPKKLFHESAKPTMKSPNNNTAVSTTPNKLFQKDKRTGVSTPSVVLTPKRRRSSGLGVDKPGLGSPRVAAMLDRRESIGDSALSFSPGEFSVIARGVRFEAAQDIEREVDQQRDQEKEKEDGRKIMEREADGAGGEKDVTLNLKEMIESLTPKKKPLRGRKSLHVGAAKGILGKRPAELDENEDEDADMGGVKRLKNHHGSPVKNVKLKAPPSKEETTGRITRASRRSLEAISGNSATPTAPSSPSKDAAVTTPRGQGRFKDPELQLPKSQHVVPFVEKEPLDEASLQEEEYKDDRMHLQDFLNMTSIRFMELTTTKRRHTVALNALSQEGADARGTEDRSDSSMESCIVAGACTVPMLDLFQHSCRELKRYIAGGRSMVREIEAETFEENPPLFREYICATPDVKMLMDNQFKNVKTHARLLSKAMWYEWRMKLLDGLRDGLDKIKEGMDADGDVLHHQQHLLDSVLPPLLEQYEHLTVEEDELQSTAKDLAECDQQELELSRENLVSVDADVEAKKRMISELRAQLEVKEVHIQEAMSRKEACLEDIKTAELVREECRGWTGNEIMSLKAKVDELEQKYGWTVTGISGTIISLSFRSELELVFDASAFKHANAELATTKPSNSRIDLWYIADVREFDPIPKTMQKDFFLQNIREHCRCLPQGDTPVKGLLDMVSTSWKTALGVNNQIACLNINYPTTITKTSDNSIVASASLLLVPLATKVEFNFEITVHGASDHVAIKVTPSTRVVYGEKFNEKKMDEFMRGRVSSDATDDDERSTWYDAVLELEQKLLARGRK